MAKRCTTCGHYHCRLDVNSKYLNGGGGHNYCVDSCGGSGSVRGECVGGGCGVQGSEKFNLVASKKNPRLKRLQMIVNLKENLNRDKSAKNFFEREI